MSGEKSKSASQTDGKATQNKMSDIGVKSKVKWAYRLQTETTKNNTKPKPPELYVTSLPRPTTVQMTVFDQENFQGRSLEITNECMNVCDLGMDKVRSLRVECGP